MVPAMRTVLLAVLLVMLCGARSARASGQHDDDNFRPEVLECEDALGKLRQCCAGFVTARVACSYETSETEAGCDFSTTVSVRPALDESESRCVLASSCDGLRSSGVCGRAEVATDYVAVEQESPDSPTPSRAPSSHPPVCP